MQGAAVSWHILSQRSLSLEIQTEGDNDGARNPTDAFGTDDSGGEKAVSLPESKETLDLFLERGAISQAQYDKSLGDLREKMGVKE